MTIQRYNQGFGGFGPLEKCKYGKLVKYADYEAKLSGIEGVRDSWFNEAVDREQDLIDKEIENFNLKCSVINLKAGLFALSFITIIALAFIADILFIK